MKNYDVNIIFKKTFSGAYCTFEDLSSISPPEFLTPDLGKKEVQNMMLHNGSCKRLPGLGGFLHFVKLPEFYFFPTASPHSN